jgi:hypothetical protein
MITIGCKNNNNNNNNNNKPFGMTEIKNTFYMINIFVAISLFCCKTSFDVLNLQSESFYECKKVSRFVDQFYNIIDYRKPVVYGHTTAQIQVDNKINSYFFH